jgi:hypothetical protein
MAAIELFVKVADEIGVWLGRDVAGMAGDPTKANAVFEALRTALTQTRAYLVDANAGAQDREWRVALSAAWNEVGISLRGMGRGDEDELYETCFGKPDSRLDPKRWDDNSEEFDIKLAVVNEVIRGALRRKDGTS